MKTTALVRLLTPLMMRFSTATGKNTAEAMSENFEPIKAEEISMHNKPYSMRLRIPPLATIVLKPRFDRKD